MDDSTMKLYQKSEVSNKGKNQSKATQGKTLLYIHFLHPCMWNCLRVRKQEFGIIAQQQDIQVKLL